MYLSVSSGLRVTIGLSLAPLLLGYIVKVHRKNRKAANSPVFPWRHSFYDRFSKWTKHIACFRGIWHSSTERILTQHNSPAVLGCVRKKGNAADPYTDDFFQNLPDLISKVLNRLFMDQVLSGLSVRTGRFSELTVERKSTNPILPFWGDDVFFYFWVQCRIDVISLYINIRKTTLLAPRAYKATGIV